MFRWYAINTYSGHENKVKANLEHRIDSMAQQPSFRRQRGHCHVPCTQLISAPQRQQASLMGYRTAAAPAFLRPKAPKRVATLPVARRRSSVG